MSRTTFGERVTFWSSPFKIYCFDFVSWATNHELATATAPAMKSQLIFVVVVRWIGKKFLLSLLLPVFGALQSACRSKMCGLNFNWFNVWMRWRTEDRLELNEFSFQTPSWFTARNFSSCKWSPLRFGERDRDRDRDSERKKKKMKCGESEREWKKQREKVSVLFDRKLAAQWSKALVTFSLETFEYLL